MTSGWIKTSRSDLDSGLLKKDNVHRLLTYLRLKAVYLPETWNMNGIPVHLEPGQLVTGRKVLSKELHLTEAKVRSAINALKKKRQIHVKPTNKFSIITLINQYPADALSSESTSRSGIISPANGSRPDHTRKEEIKEEYKKPTQAHLPPSAVTTNPVCPAISDTLFINGQTIDLSYKQKIINYCGGDVYEAGRIFFRASRKAHNIIKWIEDGLNPPCRYALLPIPEESNNPRAVTTWVESTFLLYNEPIRIGEILRNLI